MSSFFDHKKYVIHYESLKVYLRLRLKLKKKTHSQWLKEYVDFNTQQKVEGEKLIFSN